MTHGLHYTVNCSILLTGLPLLERPAAARSAGFDAVEFWWPFADAVPADAEVEAFVKAIEEAGVRLTGLNLAAGDMPAGDRGLVSWPGREKELRDNVDVVVEIGKRLGCRTFNALYGNRIDGVAPERQDEIAVANLAHAANAVGTFGGQIVVEPVSGIEAYPLKTAADAVGVLDRVGAENVRLLADFYHLAVNGDDVPAVISAHAGRVGHVQIADAPGRGAPGTGELPLDDWLGAIEAAGYSGLAGLEYKADGDPFAWLRG
ncbi:hydroxypyruvate isomerase family protein [Amycolatopsis sp. YIM 10]|uniref:hydroxypyruvate isomerase family protein n=1 Tax=Amycolatopsis sp. YIM 10 TaxID=2653857 RepID=UPI00129006B7|nr:TIM barrel protein [Amycolatopsis sp. YIM 10]QFU88453.1 Hydroxypyruvate isomerase [Amycolatopsis sp. YIM 10]